MSSNIIDEAIEKFYQALANWGGSFESEVYESAWHGLDCSR